MRNTKTIKFDLLAIAVLVVVAVKLTYRLSAFVDIGLYDESMYLHSGIQMLTKGLPTAANSPLYSLWYFILSLLRIDTITLYFLNQRLMMLFPPILLYILFRRYEFKAEQAFLFSFFYMISFANMTVWPRVGHLALSILMLSMIMASFVKSATTQVSIAAIGTLISSYVRPEYFLAFILLAAVYATALFMEVRKGGKKTFIESIPALICLLVVSILLLSAMGFPVFNKGARSLFAFQQHFAFNLTNWNHFDIDPWLNYDKIASEHFGNAETITQSFLNNRAMFMRHVASNILGMVRVPIDLMFSRFNLILPQRTSRFFEHFALLALILVLILRHGKEWTKRKAFSGFTRRRMILFLLCTCAVPSIVSSVIIFPRQHYLLLVVAIGFLVLAIVLERRFERIDGGILLGCILAVAIVITPFRYRQFGERMKMPTIESIRFIRSLDIQEKVSFLECEGGYSVYLGDNYRWVRAYKKRTGFTEFKKSNNISMILLSWNLLKNSSYADDGEWNLFLENYKEEEFEKLRIPYTDNVLLVKRDIILR